MNEKGIRYYFEKVAEIHNVSVEEVVGEIEEYLKEARRAAYQDNNPKSRILWDHIAQDEDTIKAEDMFLHILDMLESIDR